MVATPKKPTEGIRVDSVFVILCVKIYLCSFSWNKIKDKQKRKLKKERKSEKKNATEKPKIENEI